MREVKWPQFKVGCEVSRPQKESPGHAKGITWLEMACMALFIVVMADQPGMNGTCEDEGGDQVHYKV